MGKEEVRKAILPRITMVLDAAFSRTWPMEGTDGSISNVTGEELVQSPQGVEMFRSLLGIEFTRKGKVETTISFNITAPAEKAKAFTEKFAAEFPGAKIDIV